MIFSNPPSSQAVFGSARETVLTRPPYGELPSASRLSRQRRRSRRVALDGSGHHEARKTRGEAESVDHGVEVLHEKTEVPSTAGMP